MFNEVSTWWSAEKVELSNSKGLEEVPEEILEDEEEAQTPSEDKRGFISVSQEPMEDRCTSYDTGGPSIDTNGT